jgi:hypothetical protein
VQSLGRVAGFAAQTANLIVEIEKRSEVSGLKFVIKGRSEIIPIQVHFTRHKLVEENVIT